jgi:hypothetical protein
VTIRRAIEPAEPARLVAQTSRRPLKPVLILRTTSKRSLRKAIRVLCSLWGGTNSLIVSRGSGKVIDPKWLPAIRAFDPDYVLFEPAPGSTASAIRNALDQIQATPIWVSPISDPVQLQLAWTPVGVAAVEPAEAAPNTADRLANATPVEVAILGLGGLVDPEMRPRDLRRRASSASLVRNSPASRAALGVTRIRPIPILTAPFVYYQTPTTDAAVVVWNLRALRGSVFHGGDARLAEFLASPARAGRPLEVVSVDKLSVDAEAAVAGSASKVSVRPVTRLLWPRRWYRPLGAGTDSEIEDVPIVEGVAQIPRRPPRVRTVRGEIEIAESRGVYAMDVDMMLPGEDRRVSLLPRSALNNAVVARPNLPILSARLSAVTIQSRVSQDGSSVVAVRPARWSRTIPLRIPPMTEVLNRVAPQLHFAPSDKGHYARWLLNRLEGLGEIHELLTDARGRALTQEFLQHHLGKPMRATYRRSMTVVEMRDVFRRLRSVRSLPKRSVPKDELWLESWLEWLVYSRVLQLGIRVKCAECLWGALIQLGNFGETFTCPRCATVDITPAAPTLAYQLAEAAHQFLSHRSDVTALALATLQGRSRATFSCDFDHEIQLGPSDLREADIFAVVDGELAIGESKANGRFDSADFQLLRQLAAQTLPRFVVLATDRECDGGCGTRCRSRIKTASSDAALPSGTAKNPGSRDRMLRLRSDLRGDGISVLVLCRGALTAPLQRTLAEFVLP